MLARNILTNLIPNPGQNPARHASLPQLEHNAAKKNFPKQKDLSRTEQRYIGRTAVKVNTTDTRLDLFIAS